MKTQLAIILSVNILLLSLPSCVLAQPHEKTKVIAYWHGNAEEAGKYPIEKLTHIIYSFLHLKGNKLHVTKNDSIQLTGLIRLKKRNPELKVLVSLGGWGGCESCPLVFSSSKGRSEFSNSVKKILKKFKADGIDLDWEYPSLPSVIGHPFFPGDKYNFTLLIKNLRKNLGYKYEISFAAGGFEEFMQNSIEWEKVMPLVNYVNLMNYDIVNGNSKTTGHHTPLYGNKTQNTSTHYTVEYLRDLGIKKEKIIIGAAFYGRIFSNVDSLNNGIYRPGKFLEYINFKDFEKKINPENGYDFFYDPISLASWAYNRELKYFATFDDKRSITEKSRYVIEKQLGGIMFWSLNGDVWSDGLLDVIHQALNE
ncbi:MAG: glycoside hydrolase family 18 protein [Deltaproteobacteria bacterium]